MPGSTLSGWAAEQVSPLAGQQRSLSAPAGRRSDRGYAGRGVGKLGR